MWVFLARFLCWILEGEFWEVNFSRVNFSGGLFCWSKQTQEFGSKIRASKFVSQNSALNSGSGDAKSFTEARWLQHDLPIHGHFLLQKPMPERRSIACKTPILQNCTRSILPLRIKIFRVGSWIRDLQGISLCLCAFSAPAFLACKVQKTWEGCGCFWDLLGRSRGKFRENRGKIAGTIFPHRRTLQILGFRALGKANLPGTFGRHCLDLIPTFRAGCFLNRQFQPSRKVRSNSWGYCYKSSKYLERWSHFVDPVEWPTIGLLSRGFGSIVLLFPGKLFSPDAGNVLNRIFSGLAPICWVLKNAISNKLRKIVEGHSRVLRFTILSLEPWGRNPQ